MRITTTVHPIAFTTLGPMGFANWVRAQLVPMVAVNRVLIRKGLVRPIYQSGVRFRAEEPGTETFVDALTCQQQGHGDCAHLAAWLCAEDWERGIRSNLRVTWRHPSYHVVVRRPNGTIEDPSARLGMKKAS